MTPRSTAPVPDKTRAPAAEDFFARMHAALDQSFDHLFERLPFNHHAEPLGIPAVDLSESDDALDVKIDLPGLTKDDISLELVKDALIVSGERKSEREERRKNFHMIERSRGAFKRSVELPCEIESAKVEASFANGVLTVRLPKSESAVQSRRRIEVKGA